MALVDATAATDYQTAFLALNTGNRSSHASMVATFVNMYNTHAMAAVGSTISLTGAGKGALTAKLMSMVVYGDFNIKIFADGLAAYWAAETTPLAPYTIFVSNSAGSKSLAFEAAIRNSLYFNVSGANIQKLIADTDVVVKTILWTCKVSLLVPPVSAGVT